MRRCFIWTVLIASLTLAVLADDAVAQSPSASPATEPSPAIAPAPNAAAARWVPNDQRRTLRSYGTNLAYNLLGIVTQVVPDGGPAGDGRCLALRILF